MTVLLSNETEMNFEFDAEKTASEVVLACLDYEEFPYEAEVDITLVDNSHIQELNKEFREIDKPTDVLSFPLMDYPQAGDFSKLEQDEDNFNPDTGEAMLGDIIISVEKVYAQAEEFGHTPLREFAFLIAHSMLHLMGYDHMTEDEEKDMFARQAAILKKLQITR